MVEFKIHANVCVKGSKKRTIQYVPELIFTQLKYSYMKPKLTFNVRMYKLDERTTNVNTEYALTKTKPVIDRKTQILDAAEELFSYSGFDGASIRDIAKRCDVQLALIGYHFGPKEQLFEAVVRRRAIHLTDRRIAELEEARTASKDQPIPIRKIVHAYVWPFFERVIDGGQGWKNYAKLMSQIANSRRWQPIVGECYDETSLVFTDEVRRSMSNCSELTILSSFQFMVGAMLAICAEAGRYEVLPGGTKSAEDLESIYADFVPFISAGFRAVNK